MSVFNMPAWIKPHLYTNKNFGDLSEGELSDLKSRILKFKHPEPEISVVIPAWNEENNIFRSLSSLSANETAYKVEIIVINNNSTDNTQKVLDEIGVINFLQPEQGTPHARQMGLMIAKGKYHLCADSDSFYPPDWINSMVKPLTNNDDIVGVYGRYSFIPPASSGRVSLWLYEKITGVLVRLRKKKREHLNFLGFNMGFITQVGRDSNGFIVSAVRMFDNAADSPEFTLVAEDGQMALNLKTRGKLELVTASKARVFTSPRRLMYDGGIGKAFWNRVKLHAGNLKEYFTGKYRKGASV